VRNAINPACTQLWIGNAVKNQGTLFPECPDRGSADYRAGAVRAVPDRGPSAAHAKVDTTVTVTAAVTTPVVATVIVTASVVAAVAATGVAAVAGSNPAHHHPAIDGAVMAVITDAAVFRINGVSAIVHVTAAATAGFGDGGGEDTKTKNGGDKHAELFHDGGMRMVFDWGPVGDWRATPAIRFRLHGREFSGPIH
jgi:hypothetical protein